MSRLFEETWSWPVRVYWEDTDAGGVVYYANYLKFMERARTEWLRAMGVSQSSLERERGVLFMVLHVDVDYRAPARLDDELIVSCRATPDGRTSAMFEQSIRRSSGELLIEGRVRVVCVDAKTLRPRRMSEYLP